MSLESPGDAETRETDSRTIDGAGPSSMSGRHRLRALAVELQRTATRYRRAVTTAVRRGLNRLLSPDLASSDDTLADGTVDPPHCPEIDDLPARAFPVVYPTRSFYGVDNGVDLETTRASETLRIAHPAGAETYIESDTWTRVEP